MPLPTRNAWLYGWFARYVRWKLKRTFASVEALTPRGRWTDLLAGAGGQPAVSLPGLAGRPVLVAMTHPSWWDPLAAVALEHGVAELRGRAGYAPIDSGMLERYGVFKRLGFFGVTRDSGAGARAFLGAGRAVLGGEGAAGRALWVTAAGRFHDPRERPVPIAPGCGRLLRGCAAAVCLPVALEYPATDTPKPRLCIGVGEPLPSEDATSLPAAMAAVSDRLAEQVQLRRPAEA